MVQPFPRVHLSRKALSTKLVNGVVTCEASHTGRATHFIKFNPPELRVAILVIRCRTILRIRHPVRADSEHLYSHDNPTTTGSVPGCPIDIRKATKREGLRFQPKLNCLPICNLLCLEFIGGCERVGADGA